jgi:hypothetical protein
MPLTLKTALEGTSALQQHVQPGMGAMKPVDRALIALGERPRIGDSLDLDTATAATSPQAHRWDYILSVPDANKLVGVEPHSATNAEIKVVVRKKQNAVDVLRQHLKPGRSVVEWHWVTHGSVGFSPMERATRALSQAGIRFHGRGIKKL